jgi:hypothetical protein
MLTMTLAPLAVDVVTGERKPLQAAPPPVVGMPPLLVVPPVPCAPALPAVLLPDIPAPPLDGIIAVPAPPRALELVLPPVPRLELIAVPALPPEPAATCDGFAAPFESAALQPAIAHAHAEHMTQRLNEHDMPQSVARG